MKPSLRVAVAGASGIGKHHAKWYHDCGCEVVAFLGSGDASCRTTAADLVQSIGFSGRGYSDFGQLLEQEEPDVVDVCTPNELHFELAMAALMAGCHVLVEKPMVWDGPAHSVRSLDLANRLVDEATERALCLGVCTQYAASLPLYERIYTRETGSYTREIGSQQQVTEFIAEMETLSRGRQRDGAEIWIDMGSHPLSLLLAWMPDGVIDPDSLQVEFAGHQARSRFDFFAGDRRFHCDITVRDKSEGVPIRRFGVNGVLVECEGRPDSDGVYQSVLQRKGSEVMGQDFMSLLISQFAAAVRGDEPGPIVTGATGVRNLELQFQIYSAALARS